MDTPTTIPSTVARPFAPWAGSPRAVLWLILGVTLVRLVYLAYFCGYTLIEDEAHYWEWSRRLALSYYSKGPGVAWTIAACTSLFGDSAFAVRLAAPLASAIGAWFTARLAANVAGDPRAGYVAACAWFLAPMFQVMGLIMTIDGPYSACWAVAAWAAHRALARGKADAWVVLGVALGLGTLYKYTMLLFVPALAVLWFTTPRTQGRRWPAVLLGVLAFAACLLPILLWNHAQGWPTVRHLLGHLGLRGGDVKPTQGVSGWTYSPLWTLSYIGTQIGMAGPVIVLALAAAWRSIRERATTPQRWREERFLVVPMLMMFGFYLVVSFVAAPEGNWAMAGHITAFALAAGHVVRGMDAWTARLAAWRALPAPRPRSGFFVRRPESPVQVLWYVTVASGLLVALALPSLPALKRLPVIGPLIPLHRFSGADRMAAHVARLMDDLRHRGEGEPMVLALHYGRASQMAFYLPGRPVVYGVGTLMGGRQTQYDYWPDTSLAHPGLLGRNAVALGGTREAWERLFARVELVGTLDADGKKDRPAFLGFGFRGYPPPRANDGAGTP